MDRNPILSVVVPIYKVEQYLERCVNSILDQDYKDLEVILVDDGSPDRCPEICDELAKKDTRVKVIHKPNGGLSSARNAGIEIATGRFIAFVDSDDQWNAGMLKTLMGQVLTSGAQMILYGSIELYENGEYRKRNDNSMQDEEGKLLTSVEFYPLLISTGNFHESACTKIMDLAFIKRNHLLFKQGILGEDTEWMFRVMRSVNKIFVSSVPLFICTMNRDGSISNTASTRSIKDTISTIEESLKYYREKDDKLKKYELAQCAYLWSIALGLFNNVPKEHRAEIKTQLKQTKDKLDLSSHPKSKMVGTVYNLLGFDLSALILKMYLYLHKRNVVNKRITIKR